MSRIAALLCLVCLTTTVHCLSTRRLLLLAENSRCEAQFSRGGIRRTLEYGEGDHHCFKNHVASIRYKLTIEESPEVEEPAQLLVIVAEQGVIREAEGSVMAPYLNHNTCSGFCERKVNVDENRHYGVAVIYQNMTNPEFTVVDERIIIYTLELEGGLTTAQRLVLVGIIIAVIVGVFGVCSCLIVYCQRRRRVEKNQTLDRPHQTQPVNVFSSAHPPASPIAMPGIQSVHVNDSAHSQAQSAIPWAEPITPSQTASSAPRF